MDIEDRIIETTLLPVFERTSNILTTNSIHQTPRMRFIRQVYSNILTVSSALMFLLGYRKSNYLGSCAIATGLTFICFWLVSRVCFICKFDFTSIPNRFILNTFLTSFAVEFSVIFLDNFLPDYERTFFYISLLVFIVWFVLLLITLARIIQMVIGGGRFAKELSAVHHAQFCLIAILCALFMFIHFQLVLWWQFPKKRHNDGFSLVGDAQINTQTVIIVAKRMLAYDR